MTTLPGTGEQRQLNSPQAAGDSTRTRRLAGGILTTLLSRAVGVAAPLVLVPLHLSYLGSDLYGLWMAVMALTAMAAFADLGMGNGLMTKLGSCWATGDLTAARQLISSAYATVTLFTGIICFLLWSLSGVIPWQQLLNAQVVPADQAKSVALACLLCFAINIPLALVARVQYACQQIRSSNIWQAAGSASAIPCTLFAVHVEAPPEGVVIAALSGPLLTATVNTIWFFGVQQRRLAPSLRCVSRDTAAGLLRLSGLFTVLTLVMSLASSADALVITHSLGLGAVTSFSIPARLFAQVGILISVINLPLWPANSEALTRGDLDWVGRITRRMIVISSSIAAVVGGVLTVDGGRLISAWLGQPMGDDRWLLAGLAAWWILLASMSPIFMVQNAAGVVLPQLLGWSAFLAASIPAKFIAAEFAGLAGVPWAGTLTYALTVVPGAILGYRIARKRTEGRQRIGGAIR